MNSAKTALRVGASPRKLLFLLGATVTLLASGAQAQTQVFDYSETFTSYKSSVDAETITGSFTGTLDGNLITNLSNITAVLNGSMFDGSGSLYANSFSKVAVVQPGGAVVSLDGTANNFVFENSSGSNYFYGYSPQSADEANIGGSNFGHNDYYPGPSPLKLTFAASSPGAVPEPATWAMMILGMGGVGFAMRRRSKQAVGVVYA